MGIKVFGFLYSIKRCFLVELQPEKWFGIRSGVQKLMFFKYDSIFGSETTPKIPNFVYFGFITHYLLCLGCCDTF